MDKPDSSELEKVIDEQMESAYFIGKNCIGFPEEVKARIKRKIIALMPDKKEIRKDEKEMILAWGNELCDCPTNSLAQTDRNKPVRKRKTCWKCWQALGGK